MARLHIFHDPLAGSDNRIELCKQCLAPSCLYACPIPGAFYVDDATGARIIDEEKCAGCGRCAKACPLNERGTIIHLHPRKSVSIKCDLCRGREGGPLCVEVCPWEALKIKK
jgi:carbon-monoxide dehydrogenase iron sulfur subunit